MPHARAITDDLLREMEGEIPRLRRYARYLAGDPDTADDLVQDCLERAIQRLDSFEPGTNLRAWLFVILKNVFLNAKRRQSRAPFDDAAQPDDPGLAISGGQEHHVTLTEAAAAFATLSREHQEVLLLVGVEGLKYHEAADILHVPVGTVRSRVSRARLALGEKMEMRGGRDLATKGSTRGTAGR